MPTPYGWGSPYGEGWALSRIVDGRPTRTWACCPQSFIMSEAIGNRRTMKIGQQLLWRDSAVIDEKGRVRLPRKMQAALGEKFVLWKKPNGSLGAFPEESWNELIGRALTMDPLDPERDKLLREFGYNAVDDISCDPQGRFVIPQELRNDTGLKSKEVDIVGVVTHLEIWPKGKAPKG